MGILSKIPIIRRVFAEVPPGIQDLKILKSEAVIPLRSAKPDKKEIRKLIARISAKLGEIEEHSSRYSRHKIALLRARQSNPKKAAVISSSIKWFEDMYGSVEMLDHEHETLRFLKSSLTKALGPLK